MAIHPTAIIDPAAELHPSVEVGPFTIIEGRVSIGEGTSIASSVRIYSGTKIGKHNRILHGAVLGGLPQHLTFDTSLPTELQIGDHNTFREYANVHRASRVESPTRVGDHNYLMGNAHIGHDCTVGDHNVLTHGLVLGGHVEIGNRVFLGGMVAIHQFCRVGDLAILGGCTKAVRDVPPFFMANGNPCYLTGLNMIGIRRAGFDRTRQKIIKDAYRLLCQSGLTTSRAVEELKGWPQSEDVDTLVKFIEGSERGITEYHDIREESRGLD